MKQKNMTIIFRDVPVTIKDEGKNIIIGFNIEGKYEAIIKPHNQSGGNYS